MALTAAPLHHGINLTGRSMASGAVAATARLSAVALLCVAAPLVAGAEEIEGKVTAVESGDTFNFASGATAMVVRLADIDAPQGSEYYAPASRAFLSAMILDKPVRVVVTGRWGPDRIFGRVSTGKLDVNLEMVRRAAAFVCWDFVQDTYFAPWETAAKRERRGLWSQTWEIEARGACLRRPPVEPVAAKP